MTVQGASTNDGAPGSSSNGPQPVSGEPSLFAGLGIAATFAAAGIWMGWVPGVSLSAPTVRAPLFGLGLATVGLLGLAATQGLHAPKRARRDRAYADVLDTAEQRACRLDDYANRLELRNQDLRDLANAIAHDLREPARTVSTHAQLVGRRAGDALEPADREALEAVVDAAKRMDQQLADLLEYTTLEQRPLRRESVDLDDVLADALVRLAARVDEDRIHVDAAPLPTVRADPSLIVHLFEHLIDNAIRFGPEEEDVEIRVRSRQREGVWEISVEDNGIGMEPKHTDRIFSLFERLDGHPDGDRTGIGLAICRRVVERHGGRIHVETEPGQGSIFAFTLPTSESSAGLPSRDDAVEPEASEMGEAA